MTARRVLVIDDDADIRAVVRATLTLLAGWGVVTAGSGQEGLALAARERFDVILLDVMMPDIDGLGVVRQLQEQVTDPPPAPLLTARLQAADRRRYAALAVAGVIDKPFDPTTLADQIDRQLGWSA